MDLRGRSPLFIQNGAATQRLCAEEVLNAPRESLKLPIHLGREKLTLQFAIKIAANPNNPDYETIFNPQYVDLFGRKPRVIPTFGIRIRKSLEE